jgi:hypothetical protein
MFHEGPIGFTPLVVHGHGKWLEFMTACIAQATGMEEKPFFMQSR